jgi:SAM-dependent methyltransferase
LDIPEPLTPEDLAGAAARWEVAPPGLDREEVEWWQEYSDVEESLCWVQTPAIQRFLRGSYIRRIASAVPPRGRILDLGCGTGWLSVLLARSGDLQVIGVDFSPEQIRRARSCLKANPGVDVLFHHVTGGVKELLALPGFQTFDALVLHGVLHHLTNQEIRNVLSDFRDHLSRRSAKVFLIEPVLYAEEDRVLPSPGMQLAVNCVVDRLINLPFRGQKVGLRRRSPPEAVAWAKINRRFVGVPPRGPSPKEMPFRPGEIERLAEPYLDVLETERVLSFSFLAARNILLTRMTYPHITTAITWPYLSVVRGVERFLLSRNLLPSGHAVFELKECVVKRPEVRTTGLSPAAVELPEKAGLR